MTQSVLIGDKLFEHFLQSLRLFELYLFILYLISILQVSILFPKVGGFSGDSSNAKVRMAVKQP